MCLTIPKKVLRIKNSSAELLSVQGKKQTAKSIIKIKKGDWVLTQNNYIINKITAKQAQEIAKLLNK